MERRVLARVSPAATRLEQAGRERTWALVGPRGGITIHTLAATAGLSPSRVHQLVADAKLDALDADGYPPAVSLHPAADWPDWAVVAVDLARRPAVIDRIAADVDELARAGGSRT